MKEAEARLQQVSNDMEIQQQALRQKLNTEENLLPALRPLEKLVLPYAAGDSLHPVLVLQQQNINIAKAGIAVVKSANKPEFSGRLFSQRLYGISDPFTGFSVTASFGLFGAGAYRNKIKVAQSETLLQQKQFAYQQQAFQTQQRQLQLEVDKNRSMLVFYEGSGLKQSAEIIKASSLAYRSGEISFAELSQYLTMAIDIERNYLDSLNTYNQSVIQYTYFINQ